MSKPLIVSYTSNYGVVSTSYHVIDEVSYNRTLSPNTTLSASIYLDKSSYQSNKTPLISYSYKFNMDTTAINNPISQSYEILKQNDGKDYELIDSKGNRFLIDFTSATNDS